MGGLENVMGLQHGNEGFLNCPLSSLRTSVSEMSLSSVSMAIPSGVANPFLASSALDPLVSLSEMQTFGRSPMVSHYMVPKVPSYGNDSFSDMAGSLGQPGSVDIANIGYQPNCYPSNEAGIETGPINNEQSRGQGSIDDEGETGYTPSENRRKRGPDYNSTFNPDKNAEGGAIKDSYVKSSDDLKEQHEKKPKVEQNSSASLHVKQKKDDSHSGEAPKQNFIHVRARRGQATNSHSLAERVRREKISERMKLLQELVPGCNKITGKAVMLDEIINYVQSLQQQIEFLSMKLAIVNPELNFDAEQILSKDILQSRIGNGPICGYVPGISCSHAFPSGSFQGTLESMPSTSTQIPPLPQSVFDREFQSFYGRTHDTSTAVNNLGHNGWLKTEL